VTAKACMYSLARVHVCVRRSVGHWVGGQGAHTHGHPPATAMLDEVSIG